MIETITQWLAMVDELNLFWARPAVALLIFLVFLLARGVFTRVVFKIVLHLSTKTKTDIDTKMLLAFESPLRTLFVVMGIYFALLYLPLGDTLNDFVYNLYRTALILIVAWGFYNLTGGGVFRELSGKYKLDAILIDFFMKIIRVVVIAIAAVMIVDQWGFDVNGFLAGLGLGGLVFALAAKDAVSNIFGGVVIIMDKPFSVGDWILTPEVEGTVEEVTFRSTKVRTFANALVTVPNSVIANQAITNWTRMGKRRVTFYLGVTYSTPRECLKRCVERIKTMLENHPDIHPETIFVRFEKFSESSLDIFLYFFTRTTQWAEYLRVREEMNFTLLEILEQENVSIAFPSRSIYLENQTRSEGRFS